MTIDCDNGGKARPLRVSTTHIILHRSENALTGTYHGIIQRDGTYTPLLSDEKKGAHAKDANAYSLGLAFYGCFARAYKAINFQPTQAQLSMGAAQCCLWMLKYGPLKVLGHTELGPSGTDFPEKLSYDPDYSCPGLNFPLDAFRAMVTKMMAEKTCSI